MKQWFTRVKGRHLQTERLDTEKAYIELCIIEVGCDFKNEELWKHMRKYRRLKMVCRKSAAS